MHTALGCYVEGPRFKSPTGIALQAPECVNKGLSSVTIVKHSRNLSEPCKLWPGRIFELYTPLGFSGVPNASSQRIPSFAIALQAPQCVNKGLSSVNIVKHSRNLSEPCNLWRGRSFEFYTPQGFWGCQTHLAKAFWASELHCRPHDP